MPRVDLIIVLSLIGFPTKCLSVVRFWGESCKDSDECMDHRMVCRPDENNATTICVCDRFHEWNGTYIGCMQKYSADYIMNNTVIISDNIDILTRQQEKLFRGQQIASCFIIFFVALVCVSVLFYCYNIRKRDHQLRIDVMEMQKQLSRQPPKLMSQASTSFA